MNKYEELLKVLEGSKSDFVAFFDKGNNAAGTRVRKAMQVLSNAAHDVRKEVSAIKNA